MKKVFYISVLFLIAITFSSLTKEKIIVENSVIGAWNMKSVNWITKDTTYRLDNIQPGIFIFTKNYYSIMWTPLEKPREPFKELSKPTNEEIIKGFRSVVFNSGTYTITDSTLTSTALIAKVPGFEGGKQFYRYQITEDTLNIKMFDETYPDGTKPKWSGKYVTEFILTRAD